VPETKLIKSLRSVCRVQNLMLGAWAHGVRARELLGIPDDRHLRTVLSVGYPASPDALRLPPNAPLPRGRRPLDELVSWERFGTRR
jgi:nitroreductase